MIAFLIADGGPIVVTRVVPLGSLLLLAFVVAHLIRRRRTRRRR
jgi:hypothetical protein